MSLISIDNRQADRRRNGNNSQIIFFFISINRRRTEDDKTFSGLSLHGSYSYNLKVTTEMKRMGLSLV